MNSEKRWMMVAVAAVALACVSAAQAVEMEWVTVGNPGNEGELSGEGAGGLGPDRICGAVDYVYDIGKHEVTNAQYREFLNAVAASDPHELYHESMGSGYGGITRSPSTPYTYSTIQGRENMPVNYVSWYDTLRFANWMHNGQPGLDSPVPQDEDSTEDGAYDMSLGSSVVRKPGARVFLPTEDEWYKAAYYDPRLESGGGPPEDDFYWFYPTQSDTCPTAEAPPGSDLVNGSANYDMIVGDLTDVGGYNTQSGGDYVSDSAYDTFDQGGNVWEWNEADIYGDGSCRGVRGGSFDYYDYYIHASLRGTTLPVLENDRLGFRVAEVPEPAAIAWWSVAFHGGPVSDYLAIELDPQATGEDVVSEPRRCAVNDKFTIKVDFDNPVVGPLSGTIQAENLNFPGHKVDASSQEIINGGLTLEVEFADGLPDEICWRIDLVTNVPALVGDTDCLFKTLVGDTNGDQNTNLIDMAQVKSMNGSSPVVPGNARFDVNCDGSINLIDMALVKSLNGHSASCP